MKGTMSHTPHVIYHVGVHDLLSYNPTLSMHRAPCLHVITLDTSHSSSLDRRHTHRRAHTHTHMSDILILDVPSYSRKVHMPHICETKTARGRERARRVSRSRPMREVAKEDFIAGGHAALLEAARTKNNISGTCGFAAVPRTKISVCRALTDPRPTPACEG